MFLCSHSRADAIRLPADVTRLALEMLFVLTVGPKAQMALCAEVQLPSGEQQKGMRYDLRNNDFFRREVILEKLPPKVLGDHHEE